MKQRQPTDSPHDRQSRRGSERQQSGPLLSIADFYTTRFSGPTGIAHCLRAQESKRNNMYQPKPPYHVKTRGIPYQVCSRSLTDTYLIQLHEVL